MRERLSKWRRRHPRLASLTSLACVATTLVVALATALHAHDQRLKRFEAAQTFHSFNEDLVSLQFLAASNDRAEIDDLVHRSELALARYRVVSDPDWRERPDVRFLPEDKQAALKQEVCTALLLQARGVALACERFPDAHRAAQLRHALALNHKAEAEGAADYLPRTLWAQRAQLCAALGNSREAEQVRVQADRASPGNAQDAYLSAREHIVHGRYKDALPLLKEATARDANNVPAWFLLGRTHDALGQDKEAAACYTVCTALRPTTAQPFFHRGLVALRQRDYVQARTDFDRVIEIQPKNPDAFFNRALALHGLNKVREAIEDLNSALERNAPYTRVYFLRARFREKAGDAAGAKADKDEGLKREPTDDQSWNVRGFARLTTDPKGALSDFRKALEINPRSRAALENIAHVLADTPGQDAEAIATLDRSIALYPDYVQARLSRGLLLARSGKRANAVKDAEETLKRSTTPATHFRVAAIYAQTSKQEAADRSEAIRLLKLALQKGHGLTLLDRDPDLAPLRNTAEFRRLADAARTLR